MKLREGWSIEEGLDGKIHYFIFDDNAPPGSGATSLCGRFGGAIRSDLRVWKQDNPDKCEECKKLLEERKKKETA